ncbi:response regulator [Vibrio ponticus]|uniref:histidine kinase n=1 Tax=Vibrio ponticus TaxID=265668 RepID=A0A3N3DXR0_9VIBR|nr:transporter substrate-binding domain-containing protein [Vibrio ponticus]ROV59283.1 response regulator [Vibrio ponticus]
MPAEKWAPYWAGVEAPSGLYHSLLSTLADSMDVKLTYRGYDSFDEIYQALENNEIDATFGFVKTKSRKSRFAFSSPLITLKKIIWLRDKQLSSLPISEWQWVCVEGSLDCEVAKHLGAEKLTSSHNINLLAQLVKQGEADATLTTIMEVEQYISDPINSNGKVILDKNVGKVAISIMLAKHNRELKTLINKSIKSNKLGLRATRWSNIHVLNEQSQWDLLKNQQKIDTIRYTIKEKAYPLSYIDPKSGEVKGYVHDLLDLLEKKTLFKFEYVPANGRNVETMLADGVVDLLPGHYKHHIDNQVLLATPSYTSTEYGLLETREEYSERKLAVLDSTSVLCDFVDNIRIYEPVTVFNNTKELLYALNNGEITHALVDQTIIDNYLNYSRDQFFRLADKPRYMDFTTPLTMVVRNDSPLLHNMLSRMISIITPTEVEVLKNRHNKVVIHYGYDKAMVNSYLFGILATSALLFIGVVMLFYVLSGHLKRSRNINELSQSEINWLSTLLDSMPSMILITDKNSKVVFTNQAYKNELDNCICPQKTNDNNECYFATAAMNQHSASIFQFPDCHCSLSNRYFQIRHQTITHPQHGSTHYMTVIDDVSEDKQKEDLLQQSNLRAMKAVEAQSEFLAVVSHELRTPIAAMLGLMELLQLNLREPQDTELLKNAIQSAHRLKSQVNEILDFSKIEASQLQIDIRRHNLFDELCPTLRSYETSAQLKGLDFVFYWQPSAIVEANFDSLRINQVIGNLLSNALKFTEKGKIEVDIISDNQQLTISVKDSGCGMTPTQLGNVFKPFVQANKGVSRRYGGTGLGMSISKNLIELMGGQIDISSELAIGTTVVITVPIVGHKVKVDIDPCHDVDNVMARQWLALWRGESTVIVRDDLACSNENVYPDRLLQQAMINQDEDTAPVSLAMSNPIGKVLVADDDLINQMLMRKQLTLLGVEFVIVDNGRSAYEYLQQKDNDVVMIITDCHMPDMDGFELTEAIKNQPLPLNLLPVIGCTAEDSRVVAEKAQKCGMNDVLYKPYTLEDLRQMVKKYQPSRHNHELVDEHIGWLDDHSESEQSEMGAVVIESFTQEILLLNDENSDADSVIHRIKGSSALLDIETLTKLTIQYENASTSADQALIKQAVIAELIKTKNSIYLWLKERQQA